MIANLIDALRCAWLVAGAGVFAFGLAGCAAFWLPDADVVVRDYSRAPIDGIRFSDQQLVVKFKDRTGVRLRGGEWVVERADPGLAPAPTIAAPQPSIPADAALALAIKLANETVKAAPGATIRRAVVTSDDALEDIRARLDGRGLRLPFDLDLYYSVLLEQPNASVVRALVSALAANPAVSTAYPQPIPQDADIAPPTTIDLRGSQNYVDPAPMGIDVPFARRFRGGRGESTAIADVEVGTRWDHEDLPRPSFVLGLNIATEHGTAVAGVLWGLEDTIGVTGIAPASRAGSSSVIGATLTNLFYDPAAAIFNAVRYLDSGDVLLIEQHLPQIALGVACTCNVPQCGYVPIEFYPPEFAAIKVATLLGITVIEAGGNGSVNLDFLTEFSSGRDSGAVIVGASDGLGALTPVCFSNNGARVNVHSWGGSVSTLGYGDPLRANGDDTRQWYTTSFSGTSSAAPIVAGAAALIQGIRKAEGLPALEPGDMRSLLMATGTPQTSGANIGPQPDLRAAIRTFIPDRARFATQSIVPTPMVPGQAFAVAGSFVNAGSAGWSGQHSLGVRSADHPHWEAARAPVGSTSSVVEPGDTATKALNLIAPSTPGSYSLSLALDGPRITPGGVRPRLAIAPTIQVVVSGPSGQFDDAAVAFISAPTSMNVTQIGTVRVNVTNTGTVLWHANDHALQLVRQGAVGMPSTVVLPREVAPGDMIALSFEINCPREGVGILSAQMKGASNAFGQLGGARIRCLP